MRRLLDERLATVVTAVANAAAKDTFTLQAEAAPEYITGQRPLPHGPVRVRIRKRTPGLVTQGDAAVIAAAALSEARVGTPVETNAAANSGSNWAQQGRALVHAARNVSYRPTPQRGLRVADRGNGEDRSEAAD